MQIAHRTEHYPQQLSGGQQQRVAIARAIVTNPHLILADEPTGKLDSINGNEVMALLQELNSEGATVVMVTHSEENAREAGRIVRMMDGCIPVSYTHLDVYKRQTSIRPGLPLRASVKAPFS